MDTQTFVVEQAQVSADFEPMSFSWDEIRSDPVVRLALLKEARKMAGAEKLIPALYDHLRVIAAGTPTEQESMKEVLGDMLAALGMELVAPPPKLPAVKSGFANSRPTPQFSMPVPAP